MEKLKSFFYPMNKEKAFKLGTIGIAAIGIIFSIIYFALNCFDSTKSKFYNSYFAIILLIMIATTVYLARFLVLEKEWNYSRVYVILTLGWSICMQLVMPPISGADEVHHFYSAYHCSNIYLGIKDHDFDTEPERYGNWYEGTTYSMMRAEDYYKLPYVDVTFPYQYQIIADGNWFHTDEEMKELVPCYVKPTQARRYLLSGLGIAIARFLGFGFSGVLFMGRFMNSLTLILAGWICIKLLPVGKLQLLTFSLFPMILQLHASYSYDNMSILFSLILLTMCLYFSQEHVKLHAWYVYLIAIAVVFLIPNKMVYTLFAVWFFAIPVKKWWTDVCLSKKWYEYVLGGAFIAGAALVIKKLWPKYSYMLYDQFVLSWNHATIEQDATREAYTWATFLENPLDTFKFAWEGIKVDFWYNVKHVVGSELGHTSLNAVVPIGCILVMLAVLIVGLFINKGKRLKKWQYVVIGVGLVACVLAIFAGCLVRFTPAEGSQRIQISYRYLIPVYMCMCIALGTDAKENKKAMTLILIQNVALMFAMCGLTYYLFHLRDGMGVPEVLIPLGF
ncbi:DUF2142 domain-containing protein [Pseudobutyrivibrio sp.]|uniref:DUF2142 domain-containing protein n=1 Tax=Pseudobutyrivibrio sp. TaxID=2014367 RepID=UPI001D59A4BA|nr:DUF2142 domain-containing protein [Pseudobutyrivibrio sp.]MBE5909980.1 DUF2142 domain-containing protein [Pseudobutyrivibrio sp.]